MMRLSITARIALLAIMLSLVSNLALIGFVWKQTSADAINAIRRETTEQSDSLRAVWQVGGTPALRRAIADSLRPGDVASVLALIDADGRTVQGIAPARIEAPLRQTDFRIARLGSDALWSARETGYALYPVGRQWLLTGRNLDLIAAEERAMERALAFAIFLSLALGVFGGLVLARYVGRRLDGVAGVIEAAGEGDLSRRVPVVAGGGDAFDRLAGRLNVMLGKLEGLMAELRLVTDSLAHDLRSPLARLRTKTEQAVLIADPEAREVALGGLLTETDLVMRMLTMVIEISRSGSVSRDRFILVSPADLLQDIGELYEPVAEDAGLDFTIAIDSRPAPLPLHRELISQAVMNLIDNALRHGASGGAVTLRLYETVEGLVIQVEDRGPGIAEADRPQAMKRFGRLDSARTTPGMGLGMALIEAVAKLHDGRFELADNAPGLIARIVLPA